MELTKEGNIPDFSHKNTRYWIKHDLKHIRKSFKRTFLVSPILLFLSTITNLLIGGGFKTIEVGLLIKNSLFMTGVLCIIIFVLLAMFTKGYSILHSGSLLNHRARLIHKGPFYPSKGSDEKNSE